jgi:hypothetical protein
MPGLTGNNTNSELNWTLEFVRAFNAALVEAFNYETLRRALKIGLGKRLDLISTASGFETVVDDVMEAAELEGWRDDLVRATYEANPTNSKLSKFVEEILVHSGIVRDSFFHTDEAESNGGGDREIRDADAEKEKIAADHGRDLRRLSKFCKNRQLLLFIGPDMDESTSGTPSRQAMADTVIQEEGLPAGQSWMDTTPLISRSEIIQHLNHILDNAAQSPQPIHKTLAKIVMENDLDMVVTTAYDDLLYAAAREELGKAPNRIVIDSHFAAMLPDRPKIIQLYGNSGQLETLILTRGDLANLLAGRDINRQRVLDTIRQTLASSAVLFVGFDLQDITINFLLNGVNMGRFAQPVFAIWPGLPAVEKQAWLANNNLTVIDADPLPFLQLLRDS